ncbi:unnamed protein product [Arabidopsis lyrata]|nr:unnamed protein product [Arabidopsis lyrata]
MKKTKTYNFLCIIELSVLTLQLINGSSSAATPPPPDGNSSTSCKEESQFRSRSESAGIVISMAGTRLSATLPLLGRLAQLFRSSHGSIVKCSTSQVSEMSLPNLNVTGRGSPYFFTDENRLVVVGCGTKALMTDIESEILGCESSCEASKSSEEVTNSICDGYKCCQARIPLERPQVIGISIEKTDGTRGKGCSVAFLTNKRYTPINVTEPERFHAGGYAVVELGCYFDTSDSRFRNPLGCRNMTRYSSYSSFDSCSCEYDYFSGISYRICYCNCGYTGNPYLRHGCIDIDECEGHHNCGEGTCVNMPGSYSCEPKITKPEKASVIQGVLIGLGVLFFILGILRVYKFSKKRRRIIRSKNFFKRNGGLLLKQQLTTSKHGKVEMSRIFSSKELKKATDNFSMNRVLGQGGQGTVYKGMLVDGRIVAVKRSKVVGEDKMEEFINEVVLLSQINHRNIVKLMGCCLETEVPILVYEYIPNEDLFKRLHEKSESNDYTMTWEVRLRIAIEIAGALSYMHSAASFPIYHRDIKTTNILLDEKYRARVSDFGTSRSITIDQTHLTTLVAGTFGYMDPEYFLSSQYTDKSDVYSFGIVLVELITGEKPVSRIRCEEGRGLATDFLEAMKENRVVDIIDDRIKEENKLYQVMAVAKLARKCLSRKGRKRPNMREVSLELERIVLHHLRAATPPTSNTSTSCNRTCGGISIPFPFGIGGKDCYLNNWYEVVCNTTTSGSSSTTVPLLSRINKEVVNIYLPDGYPEPYGVVHIKGPVTSLGCSSNTSQVPQKSLSGLNVTGKGSPYFLTDENRLVAVGCGTKALMTDIESEILGCESSCEDSTSSKEVTNSICNGYKCCQARIPTERPQAMGVNIEINNGTGGGGCKVAFLTNTRYLPSNVTEPEKFHADGYAVVELGWYFDTSDSRFRNPLGCINLTRSNGSYFADDNCLCQYGYFSDINYRNCYCGNGFTGNPYIRGGCIDIDECKVPNKCGEDTCENIVGMYKCVPKITKPAKPAVLRGVLIGLLGLLFLVIGIFGLFKVIRKRRRIIRSMKFFKRNGGLLLKQQLTTKDGSVEMSKIFSSRELEKATDNYSIDRVLGQGGQGTVYKGMLVDGSIVAVKRSKVVDEDKMEEFINEVVLLSQINHRNIVKLLGCCLETEVPILVYEYIPNGDLFKRLHDEYDDYKMTWEVRLGIAIEIAGALTYMHSAASFPIFHRDIKTTNILLDEKYRAKMSDFGTSRSVTTDQTHLTTLVAGTFGYMDPEYFLSSQYTHKSDVYSFGVVLVELITGEKPMSRVRSEEGIGLATYFLEAMKENRAVDIIDIRIREESKQVMAVAKLARKCLNRKGNKRPNMREISMELERIRSSPKDLDVHPEEEEEEEDQLMEINRIYDS